MPEGISFLVGNQQIEVSATNPLPVTGGTGGGGTTPSPPVGAANFVTGQQNAIGTSATLIVAARTGAAGTGRVSTTLYNQGSTTVFYGPAGVTTGNGTPLLSGGSRTIYTTVAIYGVVASGTGSVAFDEVF